MNESTLMAIPKIIYDVEISINDKGIIRRKTLKREPMVVVKIQPTLNVLSFGIIWKQIGNENCYI